MLELCLTEVVHGDIVRDTKGVESNISNVPFKVCRVRKERESIRLLGSNSKGSGGTSYEWDG
jgi:hypothetical protein